MIPRGLRGLRAHMIISRGDAHLRGVQDIEVTTICLAVANALAPGLPNLAAGDADTHIGRCLVHYLKESARRELTDISEEDWVRWKRAARGDEPTGAFATIAWIPGTRDELRNMAISDAMEARDVNVVLGMLLTVVRPIPEKCIPTLLFADS